MRLHRSTLLLMGAAGALAGCSPDGVTEPAIAPSSVQPVALVVSDEQSAAIAAGVQDVESRVLPTLAEGPDGLGETLASLHRALDAREARTLSRAVSATLAAARAHAAAQPGDAMEMTSLELVLIRAAAALPAGLQPADPDYSITH